MFRQLTGAIALVAVMQSTPAHAEGAKPPVKTDYCQKVTARASADSALLFAPTLTAQLIRYPQSAALDTLGVQIGRDVQPRASLSLGFVDIYKGFLVKDVAEKDCARQEVAVALQEIFLQRDDAARKMAVERKLAFTRSQEPKVEALLEEAKARFAAGTATLLEVRELRRKVLELTSKAFEMEKLLAALKAKQIDAPQEPLDELLRVYEERTMAYEESLEEVHNLAPWKFGITAGVTAHPNVDYFGAAEVSYNFGGLFAHSAQARATEARGREIKNARYELRRQIDMLRTELKSQVELTRKHVGLIDAELVRVNRERAAVEATDAPSKHTVVAALTLETIDLEAERLYLSTLADKQSAIGGRQ